MPGDEGFVTNVAMRALPRGRSGLSFSIRIVGGARGGVSLLRIRCSTHYSSLPRQILEKTDSQHPGTDLQIGNVKRDWGFFAFEGEARHSHVSDAHESDVGNRGWRVILFVGGAIALIGIGSEGSIRSL